jgi:nickel transport system permease protein
MRVWRRLRNDRMGMICLCFLLAVAALALCAPLAAPWDPTDIDVRNKFAGYSLAHVLGTDQLGRDVLSRLIWGGRATLGFSLLTMCITLVIGSGLGIVAGFCRGKVDEIIMRFCDVMMSFPSEVLILAIVGMLGPGLGNVVIASVIAKWPWYSRMIRSVVMQYTDVNYVRFARVAGCGMWHIFRRHLLPGALGEIIVLATLDTGAVILSVSALSFLGLGVQPPTAEWGAMLRAYP